jgi:hypothetical protein
MGELVYEDEAQPEKLTLDDTTNPIPLPEAYANQRAAKADFALQAQSPGFDSIRNTIYQGAEDDYRKFVAGQRDLDFHREKLNLISQITKTHKLGPEETELLLGLSKLPAKTDPEQVLEQLFGREFVNNAALSKGKDNKVFQDGVQEESAGRKMDIASATIQFNEAVKTKLENLRARFSQDSYWQNTKDIGAQFIPTRGWYRLRNIVSEKAGSDFLPGANMADQQRFLWLLPLDARLAAFENAITKLAKNNVLDAIEFGEATMSFGASAELGSNLIGITDAATVAQPAIKLFSKVAGGAAAVTKTATEVAKEPGTGFTLVGKPYTKPDFQMVGKPYTPNLPAVIDTPAWNKDPAFPGKPIPGQKLLTYQPGPENKNAKTTKSGIAKPPQDLESSDSLMSNALHHTIQAAAPHKMDLQDSLTMIGDVQRAGAVGAVKTLTSKFASNADPVVFGSESATVRKEVTSIFNPESFFSNPGRLSNERANRLQADMEVQAAAMREALEDPLNVTRQTKDSLAFALKAAEDRIKKEYNHLDDSIIDVYHNPADKDIANVGTVSLHLARKDATLFDSLPEARMYAKDLYKLPDESYLVRQRGSSFYIDLPKPIDETVSTARGVLAQTEGKSPNSPINTFLGFLRSAEDLLSPLNRANRHLATHGPTVLRKLALEEAKAVGKMSKESRRKLEDVLRFNNKEPNPVTGERGRFYETIGDLEMGWAARHGGELPTDQEIKAYYSSVRLNDMDYMIRTLGWYRDKSRLGVERMRFQMEVPDKMGVTSRTPSPWLEAKPLDDLPWNDPGRSDHSILVTDGKTSTKKWRYDMSPEEVDELKSLVKDKGYRVWQIYNPRERPLKGVLPGDQDVKDTVHFVVTNTAETAKLDWKQAPYRPGGHVIYPYEHFVKQPIVSVGHNGRNLYHGDFSVFNFSTEVEAKMFAERMDTARRLLANNDPRLDDYLRHNLPYTVDEFKGQFHEGGLAIDQPFMTSYSGKSVFETNPKALDLYPKLKDSVQDPFDLAATLDKKFIADRGPPLDTVRTIGTETNPLFKLENARILDPYAAINRGLGNAMRGKMMNDYKISSAEAFVSEFKELFRHPDVVGRNPLYYLYHFQENLNPSIDDKGLLAQARNVQRAMVNFIGVKSEMEATATWAERKVFNSMQSLIGTKATEKVIDRFLPAIKDPTVYLRSVAFHSHLGFFNPVQLFVQMQSMTHVLGVAGPTNGLPGIAAGTLMHFASYTDNPAVLNRMAKISGKFGWKEADFKEMHEALRKYGFQNIAGETAWRDDVMDPKVFTSKWGTFLDKGTIPFAIGERQVRLSAFATAYREWKGANPGLELSNRELGKIANRADLLSVNMTRASNAGYQQGITSIPTQFLSFTARLMEQFIGSKLTPAEKLRAFATYSAMYGVPVAGSAVLGVYPLYEDIRQSALEKGVDVSDAWFKAFSEGLPSLITSVATGTEFNIAQRYGPSASNLFSEMLKGNKTAYEIAFGPAGQTMKDIMKSTLPFLHYMGNVATGSQADFPVALEEGIEASRAISSINNALVTTYALNWGKYVTKNEMYAGDLNPMEAIVRGVGGLTPTHITDAFLKKSWFKDQAALVQVAEKAMITEYRRALKDMDNGDYDNAQARLRRVRALQIGAGMTPQEAIAAQARAFKGYESLVEKMNREWMTKGPLLRQGVNQ